MPGLKSLFLITLTVSPNTFDIDILICVAFEIRLSVRAPYLGDKNHVEVEVEVEARCLEVEGGSIVAWRTRGGR